MSRRGRGSASESYEKMMAAKKAKMQTILSGIVKSCAICQVSSSKRRLFTTVEGDICVICADDKGLLEDGKSMYQLEEEQKAHLEAEKNKPAPEGYGEWS